jgi:hypothetical protein
MHGPMYVIFLYGCYDYVCKPTEIVKDSDGKII